MKKKMPVRKKILIILACVLVLVIAGAWILTEVECSRFFGRRYETDKLTRQRAEFYDGLERTQYIFPSDKERQLRNPEGRQGDCRDEPHAVLRHL